MSYTWKTEMRATAASGYDTPEEGEQLRAAREADKLYGQAAMGWLGDGRVQLTVMPDRATFAAECVVSVEDARALAHAILDADGTFEVPTPPPGLTRVTDRDGIGWTLDTTLPAAAPGGWWPDRVIAPDYDDHKRWSGWLTLLRDRGPLKAKGL